MPADLAAASILASPVAAIPKIEVASAFPTLVELALPVAAIGDFTSVKITPDNGLDTVAQLDINKAAPAINAKVFNFFNLKWFRFYLLQFRVLFGLVRLIWSNVTFTMVFSYKISEFLLSKKPSFKLWHPSSWLNF